MLEKNFTPQSLGREKNKKNLKERILNNKAIKIIALFIVMLGSVEVVEAQGQNNVVDPENVKNKIEDARMLLEKIGPGLDSNDSTSSSTFNNQDIDTFQFSENKEIIKQKNGQFVIVSLTSDEGNMFFYDEFGDGSLDRVVINREKNRTLADNSEYIFESSQDLFSDEKAESQNVQILEILGENIANFRDMIDGEYGSILGKEGSGLINQMQGRYNQELREASLSLDK